MSELGLATSLLSLSTQDLLTVGLALCFFGAAGFLVASHRLAHGHERAHPELNTADRKWVDSRVELDGPLLHQKVPMDRWCVTRDDLRQFKRLVLQAVKEGRILPTEADRFDPADTRIGPCIHTVNAQFIVPMTKAAGGVSWALMQHPEGLPCDLFVTHGWAEGTYEFVDKVLQSWPWRARHAYCCMLSNPQNLDISGLVEAPLDSPFAKALRRATHLLVVPNGTGSIYTRVWCAYEAFLGYRWGKVVVTASAPVPEFWLTALQGQCMALLGVGVGVASGALGCSEAAGIVSLGAVPPLFLLWWCLHRGRPSSTLVRWVQFVLEFASAVHLGSGALLEVPLGGRAPFPVLAQLFVEISFAMALPCTLEADRLWEAQAAEQAHQLQRGFSGRLGDAQCSVPADGDRIRKELTDSGSESAVDEAVKVLMSMGMSSPQLREVVARAGILGNVSRWSSTLVLCFATNVPLPGLLETTSLCGVAWISWLVFVGTVLWVVLVLCLPRDRKAFAAATSLLLLPMLVVFVVEAASGHRSCARPVALACQQVAAITLSLLGPVRVARWPLLGPVLVRTLLGARGHCCDLQRAMWGTKQSGH